MNHYRTQFLSSGLLVCLALCGTVAGNATVPKVPVNELGIRLQEPLIARPDTVTLPDPPPVGPGLAPGTAKVRIEIIKLDTSSRDIILTVRIDRILGYGAATPPLAPGRMVDTDATSFFTHLNQSYEEIELYENAVAVISHRPALQPNQPAPVWTLVELDQYSQSQN